MDTMKTGSYLASLRKSAGMTQQEAADRLGVSNKTISKWESGGGFPDITILPALAELYGVTADDILAGGKLQPAAAGRGPKVERQQLPADPALFPDRGRRMAALRPGGDRPLDRDPAAGRGLCLHQRAQLLPAVFIAGSRLRYAAEDLLLSAGYYRGRHASGDGRGRSRKLEQSRPNRVSTALRATKKAPFPERNGAFSVITYAPRVSSAGWD